MNYYFFFLKQYKKTDFTKAYVQNEVRTVEGCVLSVRRTVEVRLHRGLLLDYH